MLGDWKRGSGKPESVKNAGVENVGVEIMAPEYGVENAKKASMESQNSPNQNFSFTKLVVEHWK